MGCAIIWSIWKSRNKIVFEGATSDPGETLNYALRTYNENQVSTTPDHNMRTIENVNDDVLHQIGWPLPEKDCVKINVDAATGAGCIAVGVVAGNEFGVVLYSAAIFEPCEETDMQAIMAEARAYQIGLETAHARYRHTRTSIEGDSKLMTDYIQEKIRKPPWKITSIVKNCRNLLRDNNLFSVAFISRKANNVAHMLARHTIVNRVSNTWLYTTPECIQDVVSVEASHIFAR